MPSNRYKIGLLVANLEDPFSNRVAIGAMKAAETLDANLFVFPVKYIDTNIDRDKLDAQYDYQYQSMFSYVSEANLDYVIVCIGTIGYISTSKRKLEVLDLIAKGGAPVLCVADHQGDYDYLQFNNKTGVEQAITYLIKECGRKRIGMMLGNPNNDESIERFNTYKETLIKNGIPFDEKLIQTSDLSRYCSEEAGRLIDNNPDLDAIFCVNDDIATTVYKELKKRDIIVGSEVSVVGFDDLPYAPKMEPSLSSIRADAIHLGELAIRKAAAFLDGKPLDIHNVDTEFIPRKSCCKANFDDTPSRYIFNGTSGQIIDQTLNYIFSEFNQEELNKNQDMKNDIAFFMELISKNLIKKEADDNDLRELYKAIDLFMKKGYNYTSVIIKIHSVLEDTFDWLIKKSPPSNKSCYEKLYRYIYSRFTIDIVSNIETLNENQINQRHLLNFVIRDTLMFENNLTNAYALILKKMHHLEIGTSYLYLFDEPRIYREKEVFPTDVKWQIKSYQWGTDIFAVPQQEQEIDRRNLFCNKFLPQERRYTYVIADLYSNEFQYGIFLCELKPKKFQYTEFLTYQISAAVKIIGLLRQQDKILTELHSNNLALESMSHIDELTGIYNRRGFYMAASKFMKRPENEGQKMIAAFADMDNLKIVNDTYGHIEGDFSLKKIAECMKVLFGNSEIIGRVGGDEFVAFDICSADFSIEKLQERKNQLMEKINQQVNKPYKISFSMGLYECYCSNSYDLKEAIDKADDKLYIEKKKRHIHR